MDPQHLHAASRPHEVTVHVAKESVPRVFAAVLGGAIGGAILGLVGWTGANLFGYK